jgi:hypothetical protein
MRTRGVEKHHEAALASDIRGPDEYPAAGLLGGSGGGIDVGDGDVGRPEGGRPRRGLAICGISAATRWPGSPSRVSVVWPVAGEPGVAFACQPNRPV